MDRVDAMLRIEVAAALAPREVACTVLALPAGATVRDALQGADLLASGAGLAPGWTCGVWSRRCALDRALRDGDRVELYRPLTVDPKEARRLRYKGQPARPRTLGVGRRK
jgi:putative ubiquitin-RnfH superfamily antitoxin RatB of RatAB toxin-antitoxin module